MLNLSGKHRLWRGQLKFKNIVKKLFASRSESGLEVFADSCFLSLHVHFAFEKQKKTKQNKTKQNKKRKFKISHLLNCRLSLSLCYEM